MKIRKRTLLLLITGLLSVLIFISAALYFISERIISSESTKRNIVAVVSNAVEGRVNYDSSRIIFFPEISIDFRDISIIRADSEIHVDSIVFSPQLFQLLKGDLKVKHVRLKKPRVRVILPEKKSPFNPREIESKLMPVIQSIRKHAPEMNLEVQDGMFRLEKVARSFKDKQRNLVFRNMNIQLRLSSILELNMSGGSTPWGPLSLNGKFKYRQGTLDAEKLTGSIGRNSFDDVYAGFEWVEAPKLKVKTGKTILIVEDIDSLLDNRISRALSHVTKVKGMLMLTSASFEGPLEDSQFWEYRGGGSAKNLIIEMNKGDRIMVASADFQGNQEGILIEKAHAASLDSALKLNGKLVFREWNVEDLLLSGTIGRKTFSRLAEYFPSLKSVTLPSNAIVNGIIAYRPGSLEVKNLDISMGKNSVKALSGMLAWKGKPYLKGSFGRVTLIPEEFENQVVTAANRFIPDLRSIRGTFNFGPSRFEGPLEDLERWEYQITGNMKNVVAEADSLPAPLSIANSEFNADREKIIFQNTRAALLDATISASGQVQLGSAKLEKANMQFAAAAGNDFIHWAAGFIKIPEKVKIPRFLKITSGELNWLQAENFSIKGNFDLNGGTLVSLNLDRFPSLIRIRKASIKDNISNATFSLNYIVNGTASLDFSGTLHNKTVLTLYNLDQPEDAVVSGDISAQIPLSEPRATTAYGVLRARYIRIPLKEMRPFMISDALLRANKEILKIESASCSWLDQSFVIDGSARTSTTGVIADATVRTKAIILDKILDLGEKGETSGTQPFSWVSRLPVLGTFRIEADQLIYNERGRSINPFMAEITLKPEQIRIFTEKAVLCGIPVPGTIEITPGKLYFTTRSEIREADVTPILNCLYGTRFGITGRADFRNEIEGTSKIPDSLRGDGELVLKDGRIFRMILLSRILEFINVTQIFLGEIPEFGKEGMAYSSMRILYRIEGGKIILSRIHLNGNTVRIAGEGTVNLADNTVNLTLLVSPLRTIDKVLGKIPIIKNFRKIVAIPVGVYGDLKNPTIVPLSPGAVGSHLYDIMKDIIRLPFSVIAPLTR
jgi:hypothetical protein